ncbi:MAG: hypothetical protein IPL52_10100 [Flavobacteriales bacterium]|nr:hypothetical protein [Flavobacteriales bacterium]
MTNAEGLHQHLHHHGDHNAAAGLHHLGDDTFCEGTLNKLCGPEYATSYLWSTGETTECIDVSAALAPATVTNAGAAPAPAPSR